MEHGEAIHDRASVEKSLGIRSRLSIYWPTCRLLVGSARGEIKNMVNGGEKAIVTRESPGTLSSLPFSSRSAAVPPCRLSPSPPAALPPPPTFSSRRAASSIARALHRFGRLPFSSLAGELREGPGERVPAGRRGDLRYSGEDGVVAEECRRTASRGGAVVLRQDELRRARVSSGKLHQRELRHWIGWAVRSSFTPYFSGSSYLSLL
jgi:hypothetical protein